MSVGLRNLWNRDNRICWLCFETVDLDQASKDHVVPRSNDGCNRYQNLALAHRDCNSSRGNMTWSEYQKSRFGVYGRSDEHRLYAFEIIRNAHKAQLREMRRRANRANTLLARNVANASCA